MPDRNHDIGPSRILMTADAVGGVWQYSLDLIEQFVRSGAEIHLVTMGPRPNDAQKRRLSQLRGVKLAESDFKLEWMPHPWDDVDKAGAWLLEQAHEFQPDVIHMNGYAHATLPWRVPVLVVAHSCVFSWWNAVHGCAPPNAEWAEYHRRIAAGLRAAGAVVSPSFFMAGKVTAQYGVRGNRVRVIHNFSQSPEYDGRPKDPFFLAAGRVWDIGKNLHVLETIAPGLPWPVRIAGNLAHEAVLESMQNAAVYVHTALYEPFGLAVLEAARAGCCLVLSDIPSLRELWGDAALFVDPRNPSAWIDTLRMIADDREQRENLGRAALQHATRYSSAKTANGYTDIYRSLRARRSVAA